MYIEFSTQIFVDAWYHQYGSANGSVCQNTVISTAIDDHASTAMGLRILIHIRIYTCTCSQDEEMTAHCFPHLSPCPAPMSQVICCSLSNFNWWCKAIIIYGTFCNIAKSCTCVVTTPQPPNCTTGAEHNTIVQCLCTVTQAGLIASPNVYYIPLWTGVLVLYLHSCTLNYEAL
jgi:hypothetical protein